MTEYGLLIDPTLAGLEGPATEDVAPLASEAPDEGEGASQPQSIADIMDVNNDGYINNEDIEAAYSSGTPESDEEAPTDGGGTEADGDGSGTGDGSVSTEGEGIILPAE